MAAPRQRRAATVAACVIATGAFLTGGSSTSTTDATTSSAAASVSASPCPSPTRTITAEQAAYCAAVSTWGNSQTAANVKVAVQSGDAGKVKMAMKAYVPQTKAMVDALPADASSAVKAAYQDVLTAVTNTGKGTITKAQQHDVIQHANLAFKPFSDSRPTVESFPQGLMHSFRSPSTRESLIEIARQDECATLLHVLEQTAQFPQKGFVFIPRLRSTRSCRDVCHRPRHTDPNNRQWTRCSASAGHHEPARSWALIEGTNIEPLVRRPHDDLAIVRTLEGITPIRACINAEPSPLINEGLLNLRQNDDVRSLRVSGRQPRRPARTWAGPFRVPRNHSHGFRLTLSSAARKPDSHSHSAAPHLSRPTRDQPESPGDGWSMPPPSRSRSGRVCSTTSA